MKSPQKILIVRTDRIGDVVLSIPMAEIIKKKYPESKISYFIRNYTKDLLMGNSFIDEVLIADELNELKSWCYSCFGAEHEAILNRCFVVA